MMTDLSGYNREYGRKTQNLIHKKQGGHIKSRIFDYQAINTDMLHIFVLRFTLNFLLILKLIGVLYSNTGKWEKINAIPRIPTILAQ